jgi:hypothetical protein
MSGEGLRPTAELKEGAMSLHLIGRVAVVVVMGLVIPLLLAGPAVGAPSRGTLRAMLTGAAEVPGPGDPDGSGTAQVTIDIGHQTLCYRLRVAHIGTPTAAHIHKAPVGVAGPIVVPLAAPVDGSSSGCLTVDPHLLQAILARPAEYYVNVHNAEFPAGAVRGQLSK